MNWIPHLAVLKDALTFRDGLGTKDAEPAGMALEQLPYCLDAALSASFGAMQAARMIAAQHENELHNPDFGLWMTAAERNSIAFQVDTFLEAAVRTQNALIPYLRRAQRKSLPDSLNTLMKGVATERYAIPAPIAKQLQNYWENHGRKLRAYRDLSQHYALVASEGVVRRRGDGTLFMYLAIPNNPEVKNIKALMFAEPVVHALPYMLNESIKLVAIVYRVTDLLLPAGLDRAAQVETTFFRDPAMSSLTQLHNVPEPDMERSELARCIERQEAWSAARRTGAGQGA